MHSHSTAIVEAIALGDVSDRWNTFGEVWVEPAVRVLTGGAVFMLILFLLARLLAVLPAWNRTEVLLDTSSNSKVRGYVLSAAASVFFAISISQPSPAESVQSLQIVVVVGLGLVGVISLGFGMATTPRLDATVMQPSGGPNPAWAAELLARMGEMNSDKPRGRIERPSGGDLNDVIAVASGSENWFLKFVASSVTLLFNLAPWRLDVVVFDATHGSAILRRNGHVIDRVMFNLPRGAADPKHPVELLVFAAAFAAYAVTSHYPDLVGFYRPDGWRGVALLSVARLSRDQTRTDYLSDAIEADPRNILIEYVDIFYRYDEVNDSARLMDRLEPMIQRAAALCGCEVSIGDVEQRVWHAADNGEDNDERAPEPSLLLLRLLTLYTTAARNYFAQGNWTEERRTQAMLVVEALIDQLRRLTNEEDEEDEEAKRTPWAARQIRGRAAMCYQILVHHGRSTESSERTAEDTYQGSVDRWIRLAATDTAIGARYSYACYLGHMELIEKGLKHDPTSLPAIAGLLRDVCWIPGYRDSALEDPELALARKAQDVRDAVLPRFASDWEIKAFAPHKQSLLAIGVTEPTELAEPRMRPGLQTRLGLESASARRIVDQAAILSAAQNVVTTELLDPRGRDADRLVRRRIVSSLLDEQNHTPATFLQAVDSKSPGVVAASARAAYGWPRDDEEPRVREFLAGIAAELRTERPVLP